MTHKEQKRQEHENWIKDWKDGKKDGIVKGGSITSVHIKKYLIEKYGDKCMKCGWSQINMKTGKVPITLEHKDGNSKNNKEENLELLCPNCHSLTETYGALNKGKGRKFRYNKQG